MEKKRHGGRLLKEKARTFAVASLMAALHNTYLIIRSLNILRKRIPRKAFLAEVRNRNGTRMEYHHASLSFILEQSTGSMFKLPRGQSKE